MEGKVFCSSCGAACESGSLYCSICGMSAGSAPAFSYTHTPESHCTGCGTKIGPRETYCAHCGIECVAYTPETGKGMASFASFTQIKESLAEGGALGGQISGVAENVRKAVPQHLELVKTRSVWAPALLFALVGVGVGLILSFLVDLAIAEGVRELVYEIVSGEFGSTVANMAKSALEDIGLGAVSVWLLTCLGGLGVSLEGSMLGQSASIHAALSFGMLFVVVIPALALFIARKAQQAFVASQFPGKQPRVSDGVVGALFFAGVNLILSFFPSQMGNKLSQVMRYEMSFADLKINVSALSVNVFFFSFIIALLFALPSLKNLSDSLRDIPGLVPSSLAGAAQYTWRILAAGLFAMLAATLYTFVRAAGESSGDILESMEAWPFLVFLLILPNLAVNGMSYLAGGSFSLSAEGLSSLDFLDMDNMEVTLNAMKFDGANLGFDRLSYDSGSGVLILLAGVFLAVSVFYKHLCDEQRFWEKSAVMVVFSTALVWAVGACASFGLNIDASASTGESIEGSALFTPIAFGSLLLIAVLLLAACIVIYAARKLPALNDVLRMITAPIWPYLFAAFAMMIRCHFIIQGIKNMF